MAEDRPAETFYRLRVVLAEISPLIWRRLRVTGSTTLAEPHQVLQVAFGWDDDYPHAFTVHGVDLRHHRRLPRLWKHGAPGFSRAAGAGTVRLHLQLLRRLAS